MEHVYCWVSLSCVVLVQRDPVCSKTSLRAERGVPFPGFSFSLEYRVRFAQTRALYIFFAKFFFFRVFPRDNCSVNTGRREEKRVYADRRLGPRSRDVKLMTRCRWVRRGGQHLRCGPSHNGISRAASAVNPYLKYRLQQLVPTKYA